MQLGSSPRTENPGVGHVEALQDRYLAIRFGSVDVGLSGLARNRVTAVLSGKLKVKCHCVGVVNTDPNSFPSFGLQENRLAATPSIRSQGRPVVLFGRHSTFSSELARTGVIRLSNLNKAFAPAVVDAM